MGDLTHYYGYCNATYAKYDCEADDETWVVQVFGWFGCVSAWLLFLSPLPTMRKITNRGYVGDFSPLPYLVSCLQCGLWAIYALPMVTPGKLQPLVTNAVGFGLELFYVLLFVRFSIKTERLWMIFYLAIVLFGISAVTAAALVLVPRLGAGSEGVPCWPDDCASKQTNILGLTCTVFNICMYAAPLGVVRTVIRQRSVQSMPLPLTIGTGICSGAWTVYALASGPNYFILIPNIAGLGLFGMQLCVYRLYSPFYFVGEERPTAKLIGGRDRTEVDESSFQPSASCSEPLVEPTADDGGGAGSSSSGKI